MKPSLKSGGNSVEMVAFQIGHREFCVDIALVREIKGWMPTTTIPHAPHYILGVVNLRGLVLPVVDLAARLGFPATVPTKRHVIVVVDVEGQVFGLLVDAVSDIFSVTPEMMSVAPEISGEMARSFISAVVSIGDRMIARVVPERMLPERAKGQAA
ncbi:chemotaxis protein CheW [Aurantimonas sp. Leaf443]|nr:chemotaxis protein CheW [Aurantimonas sp. Leaf443]